MNIKKFAYPISIILLLVAFNISMFLVVDNKMSLSVSIGILILLLALVVLKNRTFKLNGSKNRIIGLGLCGVAITIINVKVAIAYAVIGLFLLTITQFNIMINGKPGWLPIGGNPLHKLNQKESVITGIGLIMLLSVALTFFIKVIWLANTI